MSAITPLPISSRITNPLKQVSQRQWTVLAARGILQTLVVSLVMLLAVSLLLGYLPNMPVVLRIILSVTAWGTVIWVAVHSLRPALVRWSLSRAAQIAESSIADNQERISSAVELSQAEDMFRGSPELVDHLVKQAEQDAIRVNVSMVVPFKAVFVWFAAFLPVLGLWLLFMLNGSSAQMVLRGLFSTLMPWKVPPTILADVDAKPGNVTVAQGDSVQIIGSVATAEHSKRVKAATLIRTFASTGQSVSQTLEETGPRQFSLNLDNLQQSFKYQVVTDAGKKSPWYSVTVNPRPAISRLDVRYEYPKYTGIDAKTLNGNDGNIDAVTGTKITLSIHTTDSLVLDKSQLAFRIGQNETSVPLTATSEKNIYEAKFDVAQSGDYRIKLLNEYNLNNKDDDARAVTAEIDQPPTIAITSPHEQITVRPDDEVAVMYTASDDYGVAKVELLLQVDDKPERTFPITIHSKDHKNFKETYNLQVAAVLKMEGVSEAARISYQFKATDNRDPDPQTGLSARQTLLISKTEKKSFQDKLNEIRKDDIMALIKRAIDRLTLDSVKIGGLRDYQARAALTHDQLRLAANLRDHVANTGKDLALGAVDFFDTPYVEVAKAAKEIADKQIAKAADDTARISLNGADRSAGAEAASTSYKEIIEARDELQKLLAKAEEAAKKVEAVEALKDAAKKQEEVAKQMAEHPELQEQNIKKQQEAIAKLQEAIKNDPSLQNQQAQERAKQLAELENKIQQDQKQQTELQNQTAKQEEKQQAQEAANAIAEEQKKLNEEVKQFAKEDQKPLEQAKAKTPDQAQQQDLVKNIEKNQLQQATKQAEQAAEQLKQDAKKLNEQADAKAPEAKAEATPEQQKQQKQDAQNQADAAKAEKQAAQVAKDAKKQAAQKQPNADAAKQNAEATKKAAEQIQQQAEKIEQQNAQGAKDADVQKAAEAAKADAKEAAQDAQNAQQAAADNKPQEAQQGAEKAAQEVAKAANELAQAAKAEANADQAQAKAQQAQAKAQAQQQQQQNQQAAAQAAEKAQELANKQQQIAQALAQQAQQQADAAQAPAPQQAAQQQQQLAQQTQDAQQAAQQLAQKAGEQKDANLQQRAQEAAKALEQAAKDQQQAAKANADNKPADAAQAQEQAQKALAQADQALRGNPEQAQAQANAADAQQAQAQAQEAGKPEAGKPEAGKPEAGKPEQGQAQGQPEQGQGQPQQTAAQAAQEAAQAQQQALQPNPAAAQEAAQALAQAAQAAQQGLPGQEQGQPGNEPGTEPGEHPGEQPHQAADPKMGIAGSENGGNNKVPGSVAALGINASDWAKLPPLMQRELMNASQQSGPVSYKEMIKNYYIRVAKMQSEQGGK